MSYVALIIKRVQGMEAGGSHTLAFRCWNIRCFYVPFGAVIYTFLVGFAEGVISQISLARPQTHGVWPQTGGQQPEAHNPKTVQATDIAGFR